MNCRLKWLHSPAKLFHRQVMMITSGWPWEELGIKFLRHPYRGAPESSRRSCKLMGSLSFRAAHKDWMLANKSRCSSTAAKLKSKRPFSVSVHMISRLISSHNFWQNRIADLSRQMLGRKEAWSPFVVERHIWRVRIC